jgi:hypothetical protein
MNNILFRLSFIFAIPILYLLSIVSAPPKKEGDFVKTTATDGNSRPIAKILPISARRQWDENDGYCAETCIQTVAMYYGTYASQSRIRAMIDPNQQDEVLIGEDEDEIFDNLRLTYERWDNDDQPTPQYKSYLVWTKQQLSKGYPVIGTVFMRGESDPDYDHILPFIGFQSAHDATDYYDDDKLIFYDNHSRNQFSRPFSTVYGSRSQANEGSYDYYIPEKFDYGCSIMGIADRQHETVPVQLSVDRWDEPDVVAGQKPVTLHGTLAIKFLVPGKKYSLLKYDDYHKVPKTEFLAKGGYAWRRQFTATSATQAFNDDFMSDGCVIYRCVAE